MDWDNNCFACNFSSGSDGVWLLKLIRLSLGEWNLLEWIG
jgi:hypothetical protein